MTGPVGAVVELFAGAGGAALGLKRAGWGHLVCVDRMPAAVATLRAAGLPALEADVAEVDWSPWTGSTDLLWASPPCQPGSTAGKRRGAADERDGWPATFDAIDALAPTWVLAENVLGWTRHRRGCGRRGSGAACVGCYWSNRILPQLAQRFEFVGTWRLDAADYGTPQRRRRVILWAGPLPLSGRPPRPSHADPDDEDAMLLGREPWVSMEQAIGGTLLDPATCDRRRCYPCDADFGRACAEPWRLDRPAPTVTTTEEKGTRAHGPDWTFHGGPDRASDAAFLVAGIRRIDVAEGLALQGLPADWPLHGSTHDRYVQVGNAVPPQLAEAVGAAVALAHRGLEQLAAAHPLPELAAALRRNAVAVPTHL